MRVSKAYDVPWVEKYHPNKVVNIISNEDAVSRLQVITCDDNIVGSSDLGIIKKGGLN